MFNSIGHPKNIHKKTSTTDESALSSAQAQSAPQISRMCIPGIVDIMALFQKRQGVCQFMNGDLVIPGLPTCFTVAPLWSIILSKSPCHMQALPSENNNKHGLFLTGPNVFLDAKSHHQSFDA